jgi:hypothetical protein
MIINVGEAGNEAGNEAVKSLHLIPKRRSDIRVITVAIQINIFWKVRFDLYAKGFA